MMKKNYTNILEKLLKCLNHDQYISVLSEISIFLKSFQNTDVSQVLVDPCFINFSRELYNLVSLKHLITLFLYLNGKDQFLINNNGLSSNKIMFSKQLSFSVIPSILEVGNTHINKTETVFKEKDELLSLDNILKMPLSEVEKNIDLVNKSLEFNRSGDLSLLIPKNDI